MPQTMQLGGVTMLDDDIKLRVLFNDETLFWSRVEVPPGQ